MNYFDRFDQPANYFDRFDTLEDDRNLFARVNDFMIDTANAAAGLAKAGVDLFAPGSSASQTIGDFIRSGQESQSDHRQKLRQQHAELIEEAKARGETGVMQMIENYLSSPITTLAPEFLGNVGPFAAAGRVAGVAGAARAAGAGADAAGAAAAGSQAALRTTGAMGAGVGAGGVRGGYYERIQETPDDRLMQESPEYAALRQQGMSEADAKRQIGQQIEPRLAGGMAAAGGMGLVSGRTGLEQSLFGQGVGRPVGRALTEIGTEFAQGATEQAAQNFAVQGQLPSQSLSEDVLLSGTQEALVAAPGGAIAGLTTRREPPAPPKSVGEVFDELERAQSVDEVLDVAGRALGFTERPEWNLVDGIALPGPETQPPAPQAPALGYTPQQPTIQVDAQGNAGIVPPEVEQERATMRAAQQEEAQTLGLTPDVVIAQRRRANAAAATDRATVDGAVGVPAGELPGGDPGGPASVPAGSPAAPVGRDAGDTAVAPAPATTTEEVRDEEGQEEALPAGQAVGEWQRVPMVGGGAATAARNLTPGVRVRQGEQEGTIVEPRRAMPPGYVAIQWDKDIDRGVVSSQFAAGLEYRDGREAVGAAVPVQTERGAPESPATPVERRPAGDDNAVVRDRGADDAGRPAGLQPPAAAGVRDGGGTEAVAEPPPLDRSAQARERARKQSVVNPEEDSLLQAIARLGGINRDEARSTWGMDSMELRHSSGIFGKPLFRAKGGLSVDAMRQALQERGYLTDPENLNELEDKLFDGLRGVDHYTPEGTMRRAEREQAEEFALLQEAIEREPNPAEDEEARIEREAIQAESALRLIDDDDLNDLLLEVGHENRQLPDEYLDALAEDLEVEARREGAEEARSEDAGRPGGEGSEAARDEDSEGFELAQQTPDQARAEIARRDRERAEQARRDAAPDPSGFTLTGSDRAVDEAEARGQEPLFSRARRETGLTGAAAQPYSALPNVAQLQQHPDYRAAKAGDPDAAVRLVGDIMTPERVEAARRQFPSGSVFVAPMAMERSGPNMIPFAFAQALASATGGRVSTDLRQMNRAGHTGANAMERLVSRPVFDGPVQAGAAYVVVDDVTTMGGTLAEMADHIRANGAEVVGSAVLVNASRTGTMQASSRQIREIERRYGQAVRDLFNVDPAGLTAAEAGYVLGFRDADALRARASAAARENDRRQGEGSLQAPGSQAVDGEPRFRRGAAKPTPESLARRKAAVQRHVNAIKARWKNAPEVTVLASFDDAPEAVRNYDAASEAEGVPEGFFWRGRVYLVADQLPTEADVRRVMFHEVLGHAGLRGAFGTALDDVLEMIIRGRTGEVRAKARAYGLDWDDRRQRLLAAEEVLAELAQTRPELSIVQRAIVAIRKFLRDIGFDLEISDDEIVRDVLMPARDFVERGGKAHSNPFAMQAARQEGVFARASAPSEDARFATEILNELARHDEIFRYPISKKRTLEGVIEEAAPQFTWIGEENVAYRDDVNGAERRYIVSNTHGKNAYIYEKGKNVWLDVSRFDEGTGGSALYHAIANYAYNSDKRFIGDPAGLSEAAVIRRTYHILGSALRFGTTEHFQPASEQVDGAYGIKPVDWSGNDAERLASLAESFYDTMSKRLPDIKDITYDFETHSFTGRDGKPVGVGEIQSIAARGGGAAKAGGTATRAAVFIKSLLQSPGGKRPRLLEQALRGSSELLKGTAPLFSRKPGNATGLPEEPAFSRDRSAFLGDLTPDQEAAARNIGIIKPPKTLKQRMDTLRANLGIKLKQGIFDQFAAIKEFDERAYLLARMSKGADGALEAMMMYGRPTMRDGLYDVTIDPEGGFANVLAELDGEHDRFLMWVAAKRAERLKAEGKENLFTDKDITALLTLNQGRQAKFTRALQRLNAYNEAVLKIALDSGLIDQAGYDLMKDQPYVPFYRVLQDEKAPVGPRFSSGLTSQYAFKKLKGGTDQLNQDLLENMMLNWSHLLGAAARNRAADASVAAAENIGIAYPVPSGTKGAIRIMRGGQAQHFMIEDPYLFEAVSAVEARSPGWMKPFSDFKRWLTIGVTASPTFKIRNLIRDSLSSIAQSDLSFNPVQNIAQGVRGTSKQSQTFASMLAAGGVIRFGAMLEGSGQAHRLIQRAMKNGTLLNQSGWDKLRNQMIDLWDAYNELGDRFENANRAALYEQLIAKGKSHAEAAFMARDLMDFSMSGRWEVVRFLTATVPFMNARLQGMYKLGRAARENPKRVAYMVGAVSAASIALAAAYADDDDWKKREDWDRDNYWWFKIGDKAFRIPKPFEIGAMGTLAERSFELMTSPEMTGKRFGGRISDMISQTFALSPVPQIVKPLVDVYANQDSFTGRPIQSMGLERLRPQDRYTERTSATARLIGQLGLPDPAQLMMGRYEALSPVQVDHLLRGYFGWLGATTAAGIDYGLRPMLGDGPRPSMQLRDVFLVGSFVESLPSNSSRYVTQLYEQATEIEQAYASYRDALKRGDTDKAKSILDSEKERLVKRDQAAMVKRVLSQLNAQAKQVQAARIPPEVKRRRLDEIAARKNQLAASVRLD